MKLLHFLPVAVMLIALGMASGEYKASGSNSENRGDTKAVEVRKTEWPEPSANAITIRAEGEILHYQKESSWKDVDFSEILASKKKFETDETDSFNKSLERYNVQAFDIEYEFHEKRKSITLKCDVKGALYSTNSYDFHWLLGDLPFDLYQFEQHEKELSYDGKVNGVPTEIRLIFSYTIAHCHEHVWPR